MFLVRTATMPMQHQKDGGHLTSVVFQAYVSTMSVSSSLSSASADQARHQDALREQLPDPRHDCVLLLRGRRR